MMNIFTPSCETWLIFKHALPTEAIQCHSNLNLKKFSYVLSILSILGYIISCVIYKHNIIVLTGASKACAYLACRRELYEQWSFLQDRFLHGYIGFTIMWQRPDQSCSISLQNRDCINIRGEIHSYVFFI